MRAVATPDTAIGRISSERQSGRAGRAELRSVAATSPRIIDRGVTSAVNSTVLPRARQNSGSPARRA